MKMKDKPFALIGVNSDRDKNKLKQRMRQENITWRSFWNGPMGTSGPISKAWGVRGWPTIYMIDHEGIIRYKGIRGAAIDKAVEELVAKVKNVPSPLTELREFTDITGQFKVMARFVDFKAGKAFLKRIDGEVIGVSMKKLSEADQKYIRDLLKSRR